jgi:HTH-type transcriptional regulator / antitoxin HipB
MRSNRFKKVNKPEKNGLSLASAIRKRRKSLGMTQESLATLAACGTVFLSQLEQGKPTLRLGKLLDVLRALGLGLVLSESSDPLSIGASLQ